MLETTLFQRLDELASNEPTDSPSETSVSATNTMHADTLVPPNSTEVAPRSPLMSIPEVMEMLQASRSTVNRMLDDGALERIKVRSRAMVSRKSVETYIALPGGQECEAV